MKPNKYLAFRRRLLLYGPDALNLLQNVPRTLYPVLYVPRILYLVRTVPRTLYLLFCMWYSLLHFACTPDAQQYGRCPMHALVSVQYHWITFELAGWLPGAPPRWLAGTRVR